MQSWEEYEADYFRREPEGYDRYGEEDGRGWGLRRDERLCPVDRQGRKRCMDDSRINRGPMHRRDENRWGQREQEWEDPDRWMRRESNGEMAEPWDGSVVDNAREMIRDMDEFEELTGAVGRELLQIIRRLCDSMDGDGCIALDGKMTGELKDMLVDRIMEEMDKEGQKSWEDDREKDREKDREIDRENMEAMAAGEDEILRELSAQLLFQEMLRRRHRRRHGGRHGGRYPMPPNPRKNFSFKKRFQF